jgi:uncharacterized protein (DUF1015 family)
MAEIFPFRAYRYNPARVDLARAVTQPYDKITPAMQDRYYSYGPDNLVALEKGRSFPDDSPASSVYTRASAALEGWIARGVLVRDSVPSLYATSQDYAVPHTAERRIRKGFIALSRIEDYSAGIVFRHEQTLAGPKADRLELLRHTRAHTGQLFMLFADPQRRVDSLLEGIMRAPAAAEVRDEYEVVHRLWPVADPPIIEGVRSAMADQKLVIADGHHRYETALAYRNECRAKLAGAVDPNAPHEKVMMTLFNTYGEGLTVLPTHRVVSRLAAFDWPQVRRRLESWFDVTELAFSNPNERATRYSDFRRELIAHGRDSRAIGLYAGRGAFHLLALRPSTNLAELLPQVSAGQRQLDVVLLHQLILEKGLGITPAMVTAEKNITYEREMNAALAAVDSNQAQLCCLLNPVDVQQVVDLALAGEVLPQKSTDFYPKLLSGLAIYRLEN